MLNPLDLKARRTSDSTHSEGVVVAGIHLSGPNAKKSAVVILSSNNSEAKFVSLYEKIGSVGSLFSDERIIDILSLSPMLRHVFVDCPTSEPPCVKCERPSCPGVVRCDDVAVGMMLAIDQKRGRKGGHKLRPLNPQNLRLRDAMYGRGSEFGNMEPSYSANLAPLVVRARTLQRRLRAAMPELELRETNVPFLLRQLERLHGQKDWVRGYRAFEQGYRTRMEILKCLTQAPSRADAKPFGVKLDDDSMNQIAISVESFHAFMTAAMALWASFGHAKERSDYFAGNPGWVELLDISRAGQFER